MIDRFGFGPQSQVIELASNDGYLLQWFVKAGVPVARHRAGRQRRRGRRGEGRAHARALLRSRAGRGACRARALQADLLLGNNVLAQVPDLNDFVAGMKIVLARRVC